MCPENSAYTCRGLTYVGHTDYQGKCFQNISITQFPQATLTVGYILINKFSVPVMCTRS